MKFDIHVNNIRIYNPTIRFLKYIIMLIFLVEIVVIDYNKTLSH